MFEQKNYKLFTNRNNFLIYSRNFYSIPDFIAFAMSIKYYLKLKPG